MSTETERSALRFLRRSPIRYADMLSVFAAGEVLLADESGVLLRYPGGYMMSAENVETAEKMLQLIPATDLVEAHQSFYVDAVCKKFGLYERMECRQAVYARKMPLPEVSSPAEIRPVGKEFLPFVLQHYTHADVNGADYLRSRLQSGDFFAACIDGKPAGFIGTHEEGSIGMLEVLPEYRRQRIAAALSTFQVNRLLAQGRVPYSQIEPGNTASFALHRRLGFELSDESAFWLF